MKGLVKVAFGALGICVALIVAAPSIWQALHPPYVVRYRLTLAVNVDGTRHVGSGVVEAVVQHPMPFPGGASTDVVSGFDGYAVTVDLGSRGLLFVTSITSFNRRSEIPKPGVFYQSMPFSMLPFSLWFNAVHGVVPTDGRSENEYLADLKAQGPFILSPLMLPLIVRFRDLNNRESLQEIDPERLDAVFGPGVSLESATFQITDDPVSPMPTTWPNWLKTIDPTTFQDVGWQRDHQPFFSTAMFIGKGA